MHLKELVTNAIKIWKVRILRREQKLCIVKSVITKVFTKINRKIMQEKIVEQKKCKKCEAHFHVTDRDIDFYNQVSPTF